METIDLSVNLLQWRNDRIEETVREVRGKLFGFIRKKVPRNEDAEDIFQEVLYQYLNGFDGIKTMERTSSWLFAVARNKIADLYRKKRPKSLEDIAPASGDEEWSGLSLADLIPDLSSLTEERLARDLIWEALEEALEELPEEQRKVFVWHELEKMSFREMAAKTGESINTLLSRKRYAILHLRRALKELYDDLEEV